MNPFDRPLTQLPGVGPVTAQRLAHLGLETVGDLLFHLPTRHLDRSRIHSPASARPGLEGLFHGRLGALRPVRTRAGRRAVTALLSDERGSLRCMWFGHVPWVKAREGQQVLLAGRVSGGPTPCLMHPEFVTTQSPDPYQPLYRTVEGLSQEKIRQLVRHALQHLAPPLPSLVPQEIAARFAVPGLMEALRWSHFPLTLEVAQAAMERVRVEALVPLQVRVMRLRQALEAQEAVAMDGAVEPLHRFLRMLPFTLTRAQAAALQQIRADMARCRPMHRLLQGDVGSGKTVVAVAAALVALAHGCQVALMAPTEVLASQHARRIGPWMSELGLECELVTSSTALGQRHRLEARLAAGEPLLVVGTHALLQERMRFSRLGLVIIDEQHRFGLAQRLALVAKGASPHLLVMTATPIPRTLALCAYGHLDLSVLDEKPPHLVPVETALFDASREDEAWRLVRQKVNEGTQALVVAPLVEDSPALETKGAVTLWGELVRGPLAGVKVGLIHGRVSGPEKERTMRAFTEGHLSVLVATTVVEVGIDAPGVGLMVVCGAERFGLATLHQLRGRVGRGGQRGLCVLITGEDVGQEARERLETFVRTHDGFRLAELDLASRGPGALLGPHQHGRLADVLSADGRLLALAQECASLILHRAQGGDTGREWDPLVLHAG